MAFIYINGYPAVGKLTVARELNKMISEAQLIDNHSLIDPVALKYERSDPEYQPERKRVRTEMFDSILISPRELTYIFTDQQSSDEIGSATSQEYANAARARKSAFHSIILNCNLEENLRRLKAAGRGEGTKMKLTDTEIFRSIREKEDIYHFGEDLEIDVSNLSAAEAAKQIYDFVQSQSGQDRAQI